MGKFGSGILMLIDYKSGDVQTELTFREVTEMLGVSDKTIMSHLKSDKPIDGRFYVSYIRGVSKIKTDDSRRYPKGWVEKFTKDWKAMQRTFGVEVVG